VHAFLRVSLKGQGQLDFDTQGEERIFSSVSLFVQSLSVLLQAIILHDCRGNRFSSAAQRGD
jgi:hypothetical protein